MNPFPLLADVGGVITAVIFIVFTLLSLLSQYLGNKGQEVKRPGPPPPRPQPPPQRPQKPRQGSPLADEIADFLERAQRRRAGQASGPAPLRRPRQPPTEEPMDAEILETVSGEDVAEHVRTHMGAANFGQIGSRDLGEQVAQSDDRLEARLHQVFDHQLGTLASSRGEASVSQAVSEATTPTDRIDSPAGMAAEVAAMLSNPTSVRQAILLAEILNRPESRWR